MKKYIFGLHYSMYDVICVNFCVLVFITQKSFFLAIGLMIILSAIGTILERIWKS